MAHSQTDRKANVLWRFFSSVKLTLFLLILLAAISIIGTVIPQQEEAVRYAQNINPNLARFLSSLQLFDMYHSIWFRIIMGLLTLNLVICSIDRFPRTMKLFRAAPKPDRMKPFENLPEHRIITLKVGDGRAEERLKNFVAEKYKRIQHKKTDKGFFISGERGRYAYFGFYLVHLSILLILIGAIIGSLFGFEAFVNIPEGDTTDMVTIRGSHSEKWLGFKVHCKKFTVEFYDSGAPKEFRSDLSFLVDNKQMLEGSLLVNHPMTFRGITFYQSSYGTLPGDRASLKVFRNGSDAESLELEAKKGESISLPGNEGSFRVMEIQGNLRGMMGPAVKISVKPTQGEEKQFWVFEKIDALRKQFPPAMLRSPFLDPSAFKPYTFFLEGIQSKYYTGLQVNRDPGVPLVWFGCFMMVAGFILAFFTSHRRLLIRISPYKKGLRISIAGNANKNPLGLESELDQVTSSLQKIFSDGGDSK